MDKNVIIKMNVFFNKLCFQHFYFALKDIKSYIGMINKIDNLQ
jgi:hypothetical protein